MMRDEIDRMLLAYAAGGLSSEEAVVVTALLALDPRARMKVARYEALGGRVIEEERPASVRCLEAVMKCIEDTAPAPAAPRREPVRMPAPLAALLCGCAPDDAPAWRLACQGVERVEVHIRAPASSRTLFLMRLAPHAALPPHHHEGPEITLVLDGEYGDGFGHYRKGEICVFADPRLAHSPRAGAQGCLCLVLTHGALRFENPLQRILRLLSGF
jgi:putative transcriptional regulator